MDRIALIREEERKYHESFYRSNPLFAEGTWLHKPVKTVMDFMELMNKNDSIRVLDLGCGVGRNSIPLAESISSVRGGKVVCVDLLATAIHQLQEYSAQYHVSDLVEAHISDISDYTIEPNTYDYIVAVSSLEHVHSAGAQDKVLSAMVKGTKCHGINCVIVNTDLQEFDAATGVELEPLVEVNLTAEQMKLKLRAVYDGWEVLSEIVKPLSFSIYRGTRDVVLKTNAITYVARRTSASLFS